MQSLLRKHYDSHAAPPARNTQEPLPPPTTLRPSANAFTPPQIAATRQQASIPPHPTTNDQVARRLVCKLLYVSRVCADDPVISADGAVSLDMLPDWAKGAVEQLPSGEFVQSAGFHAAIQKLHSADSAKATAAATRFSITPSQGLIVAADVPLLLPLSVHHPLGDKVLDKKDDNDKPITKKAYVDIPIGACFETAGLKASLSYAKYFDDVTLFTGRGMLCSQWCGTVKLGGGGKPTCYHGIKCKFIHADIDAIRRCCASLSCDVSSDEKHLKSCPYAHTLSERAPCLWWDIPCSSTTTAAGKVRPSFTLGGFAAVKGDADVKVCDVFKDNCQFGLRCKSIHPIVKKGEHSVSPDLHQSSSSSSASKPIPASDGRNLLDYAIDVQLPLPKVSPFKAASHTLPFVIRERMLSNKSSWKRRYYGLYIEALSKSSEKLWQALGHTSTSDEPPRGCVWYCPSVLIGQGFFAKVFLGVDNMGRPVAVKMYNEDTCKAIASRGGKYGEFYDAHKLALQSETHGGLVKYITHAHWQAPYSNNPAQLVDRYALVTELMNCSLETLVERWKAAKCTTEELAEVVPGIALQLISTIRDFHTVPDSNGDTMLHNDLNLKNIMIDCRGNVRVMGVIGVEQRIDAMRVNWDRYVYSAPEMRTARKTAQSNNTKTDTNCDALLGDFKTDVYSLGWVLGQVGQVTDTPTTHYECCLADIVRWCTLDNPSERPTCEELLNHPLLWSAEKCIIFIAQFVNPFLPTNTINYGSNNFRKLSAHFIVDVQYTDKNWRAQLDRSTNPDLQSFWQQHLKQVKSRSDEARENGGGKHKAEHQGNQDTQFQLLRIINNHIRTHHSPYVPEKALLEAFPSLVMDVYKIAKETEFGSGVQEFLMPKKRRFINAHMV